MTAMHPKHLPTHERRAATVEAVIDLAAERNPGEITTTAIAQRVGVTQAALFRHFPTKEAIFEAVIAWVEQRLLARVDKAAEGVASPLAALEAIFTAHIEFIARHPGVPRILFGELQRSADALPKKIVRALLARYQHRVSNLLELGKAKGEVDLALDVEIASMTFIGAIQGLVMQSLVAGNTTRLRQHAPEVFAIYRRGIRTLT